MYSSKLYCTFTNHKITLHYKEETMEINSKDELLAAIEDIQSRLAVVEDIASKKDSESESEEEESKEEQEVESEDEIEKLLNV